MEQRRASESDDVSCDGMSRGQEAAKAARAPKVDGPSPGGCRNADDGVKECVRFGPGSACTRTKRNNKGMTMHTRASLRPCSSERAVRICSTA